MVRGGKREKEVGGSKRKSKNRYTPLCITRTRSYPLHSIHSITSSLFSLPIPPRYNTPVVRRSIITSHNDSGNSRQKNRRKLSSNLICYTI